MTSVRLRTASSCGGKRRRPATGRWGGSRRLPFRSLSGSGIRDPGSACLLDQGNRLVLCFDDLAGDDHLAELLLAGYRVHEVEHQVLDDHPEAAGADLPGERRLRNRLERVIGEAELHVLVLEQLLVLTRDRVPRLRQDLHERGLVELVKRADDRQTADKFGDETVLNEVFGLHLLQRGTNFALLNRLDVRLEAEGFLADPALDHLIEADEGAAADEQDVGGVDLEELLVRMLAAALRRNVRDGPFQNFQQRLLDALAGDVSGDRGVLVLPADLVDLVDIDDALLALLDVAAGGLQKFED